MIKKRSAVNTPLIIRGIISSALSAELAVQLVVLPAELPEVQSAESVVLAEAAAWELVQEQVLPSFHYLEQLFPLPSWQAVHCFQQGELLAFQHSEALETLAA